MIKSQCCGLSRSMSAVPSERWYADTEPFFKSEHSERTRSTIDTGHFPTRVYGYRHGEVTTDAEE